MALEQASGERGMKRGVWRALLVVLVLAGGVMYWGSIKEPTGEAAGDMGTEKGASPRTFRVATFNIHSGIGADGREDLERTAAALKGFGVVGLNEVRGPAMGEDQAALLGKKLGTSALFLPTEHRWWHDDFGNGLLCSMPAGKWKRMPLAGSAGRGMRNVTRAQVFARGPAITVLVTHIDRLDDRTQQLGRVISIFLDLKGPAILMGDLNTPGPDEQLVALRHRAGVVDCLNSVMGPKLPATNIDWIFAKGLTVRDAGLLENGASDHPLAWAELEVPAAMNGPTTVP
jgi:endonuclease/exonuclease/phosphatase family metal-dependent hydrolase